jgi:hypothetical protein
MRYPRWNSYAVFDDHPTGEPLHSLVAFFTIDDLSQFQFFMKLLGFFLTSPGASDRVSGQTEQELEKQQTVENNRGQAAVTNHY